MVSAHLPPARRHTRVAALRSSATTPQSEPASRPIEVWLGSLFYPQLSRTGPSWCRRNSGTLMSRAPELLEQVQAGSRFSGSCFSARSDCRMLAPPAHPDIGSLAACRPYTKDIFAAAPCPQQWAVRGTKLNGPSSTCGDFSSINLDVGQRPPCDCRPS